MIRRAMIWMVIVPGFLLLWGGRVEAAPLRSFTVEQFNELYKKWIGRDVRVTGRVSVFGTGQIRLAKCEVPFRSQRKLTKSSKDVTNVQIDGRLVRDGRRYVVRISAIRELKSDVEQFHSRKSGLDRKSSAQWYELAEQTEDLGKFYGDEELIALSREAYQDGIEIDRKAARGKDAAALKKLAGQVEKLGLPPALRESLLHESYALMRKEADSSEDYERAITGISQDLPGSETPLNKAYADLREKYQSAPLATYENVGGGERKILHRMLLTDLILSRLQKQLDKDYLNGFEIADVIDREIPEYHTLAQEYRAKALAFRTEQVATLSRREILELKQNYESQQQPKKGVEVLEAWLEHRLNRLEENDTEGLVSLAEEYTTLLEHKDRAARLLIQANERAPQDQGIIAKLEKIGYRHKNGKWLSEVEAEGDEKSQLEQAMAKGIITKRMTDEQVRKVLGVPLKTMRYASHGKISEIWIYEQLAVRLDRAAENPHGRVVELGQIAK